MSCINNNIESDMLSSRLIINFNDNWEEYKKNDIYRIVVKVEKG
jgi:hypothetical protein